MGEPEPLGRHFYYPPCSSRSLSDAAAIIAFTARWKSLRLLMAQYASTRPLHGPRRSWRPWDWQRLQGRHRQLSISDRIGLEVTAVGFGNGVADEIDHAPDVGCASSWHRGVDRCSDALVDKVAV